MVRRGRDERRRHPNGTPEEARGPPGRRPTGIDPRRLPPPPVPPPPPRKAHSPMPPATLPTAGRRAHGGRGPHGPLDSYLREIDGTPLLNAEEERELACRVREGDAAARDHLARANLRLVVRI